MIEAEGLQIRFIDVGGQKSERRKWLGFFNQCTLVVFVVALDSYTRVLEEDGKTNRLTDSLQCIKDVSSNKFLKKIPFQIFLNKYDIYQDIFPKAKPSEFFPDCKAKTEQEGIDWITGEIKKNFKGTTLMTPVTTNCLDTKNVQEVWKSCRDVIVGAAMNSSGDLM